MPLMSRILEWKASKHSYSPALPFLVLSLCAVNAPAHAFMITAPAGESLLRSGQQVGATVDLGTEIGMLRVQYYWYRQGEEPLVPQQAGPALVATASSSPPYGGTLTVPLDAIGKMRLLAVGEVARGRFAGREEFDEIIVQVEPSAPLNGIEFEAEKPWRLVTIGKILEVPVVGQFADEVTRRIGGVSAGSTYQSSNAQVIKVYPDGVLQGIGNGKAALTAPNRRKTGGPDTVKGADSFPAFVNVWVEP